LELEEPVDGADPLPIDAALSAADGTARVYVIGYPYGAGCRSPSMTTSCWIATPGFALSRSDRGRQFGSPVFNQKWNLIGLHHGGGLEVRN